MRSLKLLCKKYGVTIICTIHQPRSNIFRLFDNLLLLESGGIIYYGSNPVNYFSKLGLKCPKYMNPADFFLDLILHQGDEEKTENMSINSLDDISELDSIINIQKNQELLHNNDTLHDEDKEYEKQLSLYSASQLKDIFKDSDEFTDLQYKINLTLQENHQSSLKSLHSMNDNDNFIITTNPSPQVSKIVQTRVLLSRTWKDIIRDSNIIYVRTFAALFIALLVGLVFFRLPDDSSSDGNRINSLLFLMCVFSLFCLPAIGKFIEERVVFTREHASGYYNTLPYSTASFLCELPILLITVLGYGTISYFMVGYQPGFNHFCFYILVIFTVIQAGYASCQLISANVKTTNIAIAVYVLFLVYSLLLGGFIIPQDSLPNALQWLVYTSYFFYGFAALLINEFEDKSYGASVISGFNLENTPKVGCWFILFSLWIVLKILEYLCLRFLNKEKR